MLNLKDLSALRVQGTGGGRSLTLQQLDVVFGKISMLQFRIHLDGES